MLFFTQCCITESFPKYMSVSRKGHKRFQIHVFILTTSKTKKRWTSSLWISRVKKRHVQPNSTEVSRQLSNIILQKKPQDHFLLYSYAQTAKLDIELIPLLLLSLMCLSVGWFIFKRHREERTLLTAPLSKLAFMSLERSGNPECARLSVIASLARSDFFVHLYVPASLG